MIFFFHHLCPNWFVLLECNWVLLSIDISGLFSVLFIFSYTGSLINGNSLKTVPWHFGRADKSDAAFSRSRSSSTSSLENPTNESITNLTFADTLARKLGSSEMPPPRSPLGFEIPWLRHAFHLQGTQGLKLLVKNNGRENLITLFFEASHEWRWRNRVIHGETAANETDTLATQIRPSQLPCGSEPVRDLYWWYWSTYRLRENHALLSLSWSRPAVSTLTFSSIPVSLWKRALGSHRTYFYALS